MDETKTSERRVPSLSELPAEIRIRIFHFYFSSLEFDYAHIEQDDTTTSELFEAQKPHVEITFPTASKAEQLSILRACKLFYAEASQQWQSLVHFRFSCTETFVFFFSRLPSGILTQIRYVTVKAFPFPIYPINDSDCYYTHEFSDTLCLFKGLQLARLVVLDAFHDPGVNDGWGDSGTYLEVTSLLENDGWKELWFVSPTDEFINSKRADRSLPQPISWRAKLVKKDGPGADVKVFRAREIGVKGAAFKEGFRDDLDIDPLADATQVEPDTPQSTGKETVVIATRRDGANYVQTGKKLSGPLGGLCKKYGSWPDIKANGHLVEGRIDPCAHL